MYVSLYDKKAPDVTQGFVVIRHLPQVILPHIGLEGSPGERLAGHGYDPAFLIPPGISRRWHNETDLRSLLPECTGKVMSKEQSVVTPPFGQQLHGLVKAVPRGLDFALEPLAERKTIRPRLANHNAKEFLSGHSLSSTTRVL